MATVYTTYEFGAAGYIELAVEVAYDGESDDLALESVADENGEPLPAEINGGVIISKLRTDMDFRDRAWEKLGINPADMENAEHRRDYHDGLGVPASPFAGFVGAYRASFQEAAE